MKNAHESTAWYNKQLEPRRGRGRPPHNWFYVTELRTLLCPYYDGASRLKRPQLLVVYEHFYDQVPEFRDYCDKLLEKKKLGLQKGGKLPELCKPRRGKPAYTDKLTLADKTAAVVYMKRAKVSPELRASALDALLQMKRGPLTADDWVQWCNQLQVTQ